MDYVYTIQGWIKGVNSNTLDVTRDQGNDANLSVALSGVEALHKNVAKDAYGYSLRYYGGDYKSISGIDGFIASTVNLNTAFAADAPNLFNGNISSMTTAITDADPTSATFGQAQPQLTAYRYDQLNRIKQMKAYRDINLATNTWNATYDAAYQENFTYDANGNIKTLERNGKITATTPQLEMDRLTYQYERIDNTNATYSRNTNKLRWVDDGTPSGNYTGDIDDQEVNNYEYDGIGNLTKDVQEGIEEVKWNVSGKVTEVRKVAGKPDLEFRYDAQGNRIAKIVKPAATKTDPNTWTTTWYVRDASGNVMSTYEQKYENSVEQLLLSEQMIYGSSRVGLAERNENLLTLPEPSESSFTCEVGLKRFEGMNHLGNVLTVFSDRRNAVISGGNIVSYTSDIVSTSDYYAFGMVMPGRQYVGSQEYEYGFNGKRFDKEWNSGGAMYDYGFRIYDPRIAKFLSVDPLTRSYPMLTPYQFASNNPIRYIDLDGLEAVEPPQEDERTLLQKINSDAGVQDLDPLGASWRLLKAGYKKFNEIGTAAGTKLEEGKEKMEGSAKNDELEGKKAPDGNLDYTTSGETKEDPKHVPSNPFGTKVTEDFYDAIKAALGPKVPGLTTLKAGGGVDGRNTPEGDLLLDRIKETFEKAADVKEAASGDATMNVPLPGDNSNPEYSYTEYKSLPNQNQPDTSIVIRTNNTTGQKDSSVVITP